MSYGKDIGDEGKIDVRINAPLSIALRLYMMDHHLQNHSEVMRSALGKFLESEGYLVKTRDGYKVFRRAQ
jgi:hypothetical protein